MITVRDAASVLSLTPARLKQILKQDSGLEYKKINKNNGLITIPETTMAKLLKNRGKKVVNKKVVIKSQKGGVGGTSITLQTAIRIPQTRGSKVLVIDADPEASSTSFLLQEDMALDKLPSLLEIFKNDIPMEDCIVPTRFDGVFLIPAKGIMRRVDRLLISENPKKLIQKKLSNVDTLGFSTIFFDLPPTYSRLSESCYLASDLVILPTDPSGWGIEGVALTYEDINYSCEEFEVKNKPEIRILINKYNPMRVASKESWTELAKNFKDLLLPITIKESADFQNANNDGHSIFKTRCSHELRASIDEICRIIAPIESLSKEVIQ